MRFLADEDIPDPLIKAIRRKGYAVKDLKEEKLAGISDRELIALADKEKMIILAFDKDFAELLRSPKRNYQSISLLRYKDKSPQNVTDKFIYLLNSPIKERFENSFCEVFDNQARIFKQDANRD